MHEFARRRPHFAAAGPHGNRKQHDIRCCKARDGKRAQQAFALRIAFLFKLFRIERRRTIADAVKTLSNLLGRKGPVFPNKRQAPGRKIKTRGLHLGQ